MLLDTAYIVIIGSCNNNKKINKNFKKFDHAITKWGGENENVASSLSKKEIVIRYHTGNFI